jgi:opacity protein-like surface antigen
MAERVALSGSAWSRAVLTGLLAVALGAVTARADDPDPHPAKVSFSAFGTLGVVHSSEGEADYTLNAFKPGGAGFRHDWSGAIDSLAGVQLTARPTSKLSAVLQVVSEQNYDGAYWPHVEWASVKYQFTPDFSLRVGRTVLPVLLVTDSRKIGYTNPWVRPPVEVYSTNPVTNNDGVDASYRLRIGTMTNTFLVTVGRSDKRFPDGEGFSTVKTRGLASFVDTFEHGFVTVRANVGRARVSIAAFDPLMDAFRAFGPEGEAIADKYQANKTLVSFFGLGASYDPGRFFVMGEWSQSFGSPLLARESSGYVSAGYRRGKVTPYATYAQVGARNRSDPGLSTSALPPSLAGPALGLNAALNGILGGKPVQKAVSLGARFDLVKNTALKIQYERLRIGKGSPGTLVNLQPGFVAGGTVHVLSATVDFVF